VRWSNTRNEFLVEQKVNRGSAVMSEGLWQRWNSLSEADRLSKLDDLIRAQDGYAFVLSVKPGDRMPCPRCKRVARIPVLEMREAKCPHCHKRFRAVYYPLGPMLLEHLRYTDPYRGGLERVERDLEVAEEHRLYQGQRKFSRETEAAWKEDKLRLFQGDMVGYTGKEARL
jgi:hypothetical protein